MPETITVLLTALSTFPWDAEKKDYKALVRNKYYYKDKNETDIEVEGIYQLDPLVNLLVKQEKKLDKVILLATRQTKEAVELVADDYMEDQVISPVDYFKRHLQVSMKEDLSEENCHTIEIDENQPSAAIKQVASDIQEWGMSNTIELYVDTHGGFRSNALIMEAIVDLIAEDRIQAHFYNVQFGQGKNRILEDESAKIFDFVSGIREFTNYGRIDSLEHFEDKDSCATLLAPIREISNGIQWCNLSFFELGLRHLNNYFKTNSVMSVDLSASGADLCTAKLFIQENETIWLEKETRSWSEADTDITKGKIISLYSNWMPKILIMDADGLGYPIWISIQKIIHNAIGFRGAKKPERPFQQIGRAHV